MIFRITILGSSAALPSRQRNPSSQVVQVDNSYYLLDCAEGTQLQLIRLGLPYQRINHIFISHVHGDHFFGLPGLLSTFSLSGRKKPLDIYAPARVGDIMDAIFAFAGTGLGYEVRYHLLPERDSIMVMEDNQVVVTAFPLKHSIPTYGYIFREQARDRKIRKGMLNIYQMTYADRINIKKGKDLLLDDGRIIPNELLTIAPPPARSYAWCNDTAYDPELAVPIKGVDLLYHEATYANDKEQLAHERMHSTAAEAALLARTAEAKRLLIGHFSTRYKDVSPLLMEARKVFPETYLAEDGMEISI